MVEKKNFDDLLKSIVITFIFLCSISAVYFEGKIAY